MEFIINLALKMIGNGETFRPATYHISSIGITGGSKDAN